MAQAVAIVSAVRCQLEQVEAQPLNNVCKFQWFPLAEMTSFSKADLPPPTRARTRTSVQYTAVRCDYNLAGSAHHPRGHAQWQTVKRRYLLARYTDPTMPSSEQSNPFFIGAIFRFGTGLGRQVWAVETILLFDRLMKMKDRYELSF